MFEKWLKEGNETIDMASSMKFSITSNNITEIIGRANSGKSYLLNEIILLALRKGLKIAYFDSNASY